MSDIEEYEQRVQAIRAYNQPILDEWQTWLEGDGLAGKTVRRHMSNASLFAEYLLYYTPIRPLDQGDSGDVRNFLWHWFPRKVAPWPTTIASERLTLRRLFHWMGETGRIAQGTVDAVTRVLTEHRATFQRRRR
jgi:hypothetical protein